MYLFRVLNPYGQEGAFFHGNNLIQWKKNYSKHLLKELKFIKNLLCAKDSVMLGA